MEIKVLGSGCAGCKALYETTLQAIEELGIKATVIKVEDMMAIMSYNVMRMPALVINEQVVASGKKLTLAEVKTLITTKR